MSMTPPTCQMTMGEYPSWYLCDKPAKAWIPDQFKRSRWNGRQHLCGLHQRAHDRVASRMGRPLSIPLDPSP